MKLDTDQVLELREPHAPGANAPVRWKLASAVLAAAIAAILVLYWPTAHSMVATWMDSTAFAHGPLIVPIVLALVWRKRAEIADLSPRPDYLGFALLAAAGFVWLVGAAGQVLVLQQYAMTAMIAAVVLAVAGRRVALALVFPLAFLLFAVPAGEAFVPRLMNWTADATVAALRVSGIPVYREGNFFAIPSGQWSVVEACSGLRYVIASLTVGTLFAYLNYRKSWKQVLFVAVAVAVPIAANFARAYLIVMIGHLSNMRLGVGVDHMLFGWVFFGAVILVLFWFASFWRDEPPAKDATAPVRFYASPVRTAIAASAAGVVAIAAVWPLYAAYLDRPGVARSAPALAGAAPSSGWTVESGSFTDWRPHYVGAAASRFDVYRKGERAVALYVAYYRDQRQGAELVGWQNVIADPAWVNVGAAGRARQLGVGEVEVRETRLHSGRQHLLVWDWFNVAGMDSSNPYLAKALLARDRLLGRGDDSAALVMAAPYAAGPAEAAETLQEFAREMLPAIHATLEAVKLGEEQ
jgi:exosortase A